MRPVDIQTSLPAEFHTFRAPWDLPEAHKLLGLGNNLHSSSVHISSMRGKRRIVLSTLGSLGDLHPVMGLGLGLQERGHDVVLATSEFYREKIAAAGLEFSPLRPLAAPDDPQLVRRVMDFRTGPEYLIRTLLLPHVRDMYDDMSKVTEGADFLISGEVVVAAPLIAEKRGIPWAAAILAPFSFFSAHDPPVVPFVPGTQLLTRAPPFVQRRLLDVARFLTRNWGEPIVQLRRSLGLRPTRHPLLLDRFSPYLNLAMFSSVLGRPQPDWPPNTVQTGFVFYDEQSKAVPEPLQHFLDSGPQPVTFTLGSTAVMDPGRFFEESAAAAHLLSRRALLLMGKNTPPANLSQDVFAADYAPYSRVFPQSACVVHQGGVGTTAQALRAGVPQLVMPYAFDQPDNAARVIRIGTGLGLSRQRYRADRVARRLDKLLASSAYAGHAGDAARRVGAENGASAACDSVEHAMATLCRSAAGV